MTELGPEREYLSQWFYSICPLLTKDKLDAALIHLRNIISVDYLNFLLHVNGGLPLKQTFDFGFGEHSNSSLFGILYGVNCDKVFDLLEYNPHARVSATGLVLIGQDAGGNDIALRVRDNSNQGSIVFLDHEKESSVHNEIYVAKSFAHFVQDLY